MQDFHKSLVLFLVLLICMKQKGDDGMASVDWQKIKAGTIRKTAVHFQQDLREKVHHQNQHIDPTMTKYNFSIGASDFYEVCEKVERRIKEVDEKHPPKRVKKDTLPRRKPF